MLDTSVLIACEQARPLDADAIPDELALSVVTLAELELGVHLASDEHIRAKRLATLHAARETYVALPVDATVASKFAELVAATRESGKRMRIQDAWIAATAQSHDAAVVTQDGDYDDVPGLAVVRV